MKYVHLLQRYQFYFLKATFCKSFLMNTGISTPQPKIWHKEERKRFFESTSFTLDMNASCNIKPVYKGTVQSGTVQLQ